MVILFLICVFTNFAIATQAWTTVNNLNALVIPRSARDTQDISSLSIPASGVTITVVATQSQPNGVLPPISSLRSSPTSSTPASRTSRASTTPAPPLTSYSSYSFIASYFPSSTSEVQSPTIIVLPSPSGQTSSSPDSNALRSMGLSNSIIAVIAALSALAGLSLLIFAFLCLRAFRRRRQAVVLSGLPDLEREMGEDQPSSFVIGSTTRPLQDPPEMRQQRAVESERTPPNPIPLPRSIDPFQDSSPSDSNLDDEDQESVVRTRRGTIASSVTSFNMTSPVWLSRSIGPSTRQPNT